MRRCDTWPINLLSENLVNINGWEERDPLR
jgi:hypothetical protein